MPQLLTDALAPACAPKSAFARASDPLTLSDRQIIADVLTWDRQEYTSPEEIETIAIQSDVVWVKLTDNRAVPLHVDTFRNIRRQQLEEQNLVDVEPAPEKSGVEVDSVGFIYRVWKGITLIGTFYQSPVSGNWLAFPKRSYDFHRYATADEATSAIALVWNHEEANYSTTSFST